MFKPGPINREKYFERVRRVKRWMRPLPRRATVHRYPVLKWFAETARKRCYLWSFKRDEMVIAIYVGSILTFLPLYGVQIALGFALALLFRCNLMVVMALVMVSNPLTIGPMWLANYYVGDFFMNVFSIDASQLHMEGIRSIEAEEGVRVASGMRTSLKVYTSISLGGLILGYFTGFIISFIYQWGATRYEMTHPHQDVSENDDNDDKNQPVPFPRQDSA